MTMNDGLRIVQIMYLRELIHWEDENVMNFFSNMRMDGFIQILPRIGINKNQNSLNLVMNIESVYMQTL